MPSSTEFLPNTIRVKLIKQQHGGLGFLVKQRMHKPFVVVADLVAGGVAEESNLVQVGDIILRINDINLMDMSYESAVEILKAIPVAAPVVLLLRGPEGFTTHLETVFLENGMPKTTRVTRPIQDSLMGRIKKTFSSNGSASPVRTLKRFCKGESDTSTQCSQKTTDSSGNVGGMFTDISGTEVSKILNTEASILSSTAADNHFLTGTLNSKIKAIEVYEQKAVEDTVHKETMSSPTILITTSETSPVSHLNEEVQLQSHGLDIYHRAIEILQNNDEITVIVKGDVKIQHDMANDTADTPKQFKIKCKQTFNEQHTEAPQQDTSQPQKISDKCLQPQDLQSSPENYHDSDPSDNEEKKSSSSIRINPSAQRKGSDQRGSMASPKKFTKLHNLLDEKTYVDVLHQKVFENVTCTPERCMGSMMNTAVKTGPPRKAAELLVHAKDFVDQYYSSIKRQNTPAHNKRWQEIHTSIAQTGTYDLTTAELSFGAKTGWRNSPRCIGRIQWSKLQVFDARHITTARGMYEALCNHIKYGTNKGNLRSAITIFPQRVKGRGDYRVWNSQLIMYAGYRQPDGSVIGDPKTVEFTEVVMKMGWKPKGSMFDVLPLVLSAAGQDPEFFDIPQELILEINLKHPKYPWFAEMGLKWYALPAVSGMLFDCGGLEFTACPFNGWYMGTEIGARDLCDVNRYNILEKVAMKMGLDTRKSSSLWKDRALVEINIAVLHSYQACGVTITDHHAAAESFMKHLENEQKLRGGCPGDWVWIVPPISGSLTPVFHQEMLMYKLKPSYEYQEEPWKTHVWKKDRDKPKTVERPKRKFGFKELARAVKFSAKLMGRALARRVKCTILFATETGKSERFANTLCEIFKHAFDARVVCMDSYDVISLEHESLVLIVTSTFGNGDPPENGEVLAKGLYEMKHPEKAGSINFSSSSYIRMSIPIDSSNHIETDKDNKLDDNLTMESGPLSNVRYSVFALGSRAYPHFAAFGHYMEKILSELGAECIYPTVEGDELCGQEESFRKWAEAVFMAACETFCLGDDVNISEATGALSNADHTWTPGRFRITTVDNTKEVNVCQGLSQLHGKVILPCKITDRIQLQAPNSSRQTILIKLNTQDSSELQYAPGDHIGIFPANNSDLVDAILARLHNAPPPDQIVKVEFLQEVSTALGSSKNWTQYEKMPVCSLRTAFTHYVDITTPPSQTFLHLLSTLTSRVIDKERLELLATDSKVYEDWRYDLNPNLLEVLDQFPSLKVLPSLLITQLPLLQQRFYSISSSPQECVGEIHITVAVVKYRTQNGAGPIHEGVCSGWLNKSDIGTMIPCAVRAAHAFHMPEDQTLPIIMVGPGTGIAPFRSFWQQRKVDVEMNSIPARDSRKGWGEMYLYFGCRQNDIDNIYKDELIKINKDKILTEVFIALSREQGKPKLYVQDILLKNAGMTYEAIVSQCGHFYVCGDVSMANDVTKTLEHILCQYGDMNPNQAKNFVLKMKDGNRFHEDIFGVSIHRNTEAGDRSKDQSKRAWKFIDTTSKPSLKEVAKPIPLLEKRTVVEKPKAPMKNVFINQKVSSESTKHCPH